MNDDAKSLSARYAPKELKSFKTDLQLGLVRFSPCGVFLFAGGLDGTVRRWKAAGDDFAELPPLVGRRGWVQAIAFGRDRQIITSDSWGGLCSWSYAEDQPARNWSNDVAHDGWIRAVAVSPDVSLVATCGRDQQVRVWSAVDGARRLELGGHNEDVFCVAFHPSGRSLVSGDSKGVLKHWDLGTGACMREDRKSVV